MTNNNTLKYRVGVLEKRIDSLDRKIDKLLVNDIPHIHQSIIEMKTRINVLTVINVSAVILGVLIAKYL